MGRPRRVITQEECQRLNSLRVIYKGQALSYPQITEILKEELGWKSYYLIQQLISKLFIKVDRGVYAFPKEPVFIGKIQGVFDSIADKRKKAYEEEKKAPEVVITNPISEAIKLLKENGYKVIKQKFDLEAALQNPDSPVSDFIITEEF